MGRELLRWHARRESLLPPPASAPSTAAHSFEPPAHIISTGDNQSDEEKRSAAQCCSTPHANHAAGQPSENVPDEAIVLGGTTGNSLFPQRRLTRWDPYAAKTSPPKERGPAALTSNAAHLSNASPTSTRNALLVDSVPETHSSADLALGHYHQLEDGCRRPPPPPPSASIHETQFLSSPNQITSSRTFAVTPFFDNSNPCPRVLVADPKPIAGFAQSLTQHRCSQSSHGGSYAAKFTVSKHLPRRTEVHSDTSRTPPYPHSYWIHVWPCFGSYSSGSKAVRLCVLPHHVNLKDVLEHAATVVNTQPAASHFFEPDGKIVRSLGQLRPEHHYLLFPSGGFYRQDSVPSALLQILVKSAQLSLLNA